MSSTRWGLDGPSGEQRPRVSHVPEYVSSAGEEAIELAAAARLHLDDWEQFVLVGGLGERADGKWAAFEVGIDAPRQNGKGSILEARELAGAVLFGERLIIHSAHEQATSSEHFRRMLQLLEEAEFQRRIKKVVRGKGSEAIEFKDGTRIFFKTRTGGGGRGLTGDFVGLDEAMILPVATTAALVPTMAARSIHGNPQLWYAGSAVDQQKHEHGLVFSRLRKRGMDGAPNVAWFEWSVEGDNPDTVPPEVREDPANWAQANPGLGIRISAEHIANECGGALGPREFAVERLGIGDWPDPNDLDGRVFKPGVWAALKDGASAPLDPVAFAVAVKPDRSVAVIAAVGRRQDGRKHVEVVHRGSGTGWVAERLAGLAGRWRNVGVYANGVGSAASLGPELLKVGLEVQFATAGEYARACGMFFDAVDQDALRHLGTDELAAAVDGARKRHLSEAWAWSHKESESDITSLEAVTLALWGLETEDVVDLAQNVW
jgi:hypothetical protein